MNPNYPGVLVLKFSVIVFKYIGVIMYVFYRYRELDLDSNNDSELTVSSLHKIMYLSHFSTVKPVPKPTSNTSLYINRYLVSLSKGVFSSDITVKFC